MEHFLKLLETADYGVEIPYAGSYYAYVKPDLDYGGFSISFHKGEMPAHAQDHADTAEDAANIVAQVADLEQAREIEAD